MKHIWTVLCNKSILDKYSNNITLVNVLETLNIEGSIDDLTKVSKSKKGNIFPYNLSIVSLWAREDEKGDVNFIFKLEIEDPEGEIIAENEREVPLNSQHKRTRTRINMNGIKITSPGDYIFRISKKINDDYIICAEVPLEINFKNRKK